MIDFIVSVQLKFFDPAITDFSVGNFVLRESDSTQRLAHFCDILCLLPIDLYLFFFKVAEKVFPVIRYKRFKGKVLFLRNSYSHDKWRLWRVNEIIPHFPTVANVKRPISDERIPE